MNDHADNLLRVAHPMKCNNATNPPEPATTRATSEHQMRLKALCAKALERNNPRNSSATQGQKVVAQPPQPAQHDVAPIDPAESVALLRCPRDATRNKPDSSPFWAVFGLAGPAACWRLTEASGAHRIVVMWPEATAADVQRLYPGCSVEQLFSEDQRREMIAMNTKPY